MDANTPAGQQHTFGRMLTEQFLMHTAKPASTLTVRKQRTCLQTQLSKQHLDAAMKDWVVFYRHDWQFSIGPTHYTPALGRDTGVLLPTTEWPFDHAMVEASLAPPRAACRVLAAEVERTLPTE